MHFSTTCIKKNLVLRARISTFFQFKDFLNFTTFITKLGGGAWASLNL